LGSSRRPSALATVCGTRAELASEKHEQNRPRRSIVSSVAVLVAGASPEARHGHSGVEGESKGPAHALGEAASLGDRPHRLPLKRGAHLHLPGSPNAMYYTLCRAVALPPSARPVRPSPRSLTEGTRRPQPTAPGPASSSSTRRAGSGRACERSARGARTTNNRSNRARHSEPAP
jgi:hypothetical protein